ncbi:hypothetical protein [Paracoccus sp. (in: a-proteobacteria)]|uniref:hypothetical protein n=1 Tax=Paracoccus sp. TaxID=267 RepID=UPI003A870C29
MPQDLLSDDCARCAALCCMALAFDEGPSFAIGKPAGTPCRHLGADHGCAIHQHRRTAGFSGCIGYSCNGAGQRVTQECFGGRSWRDAPELAVPMIEAFQRARRIHDWLLLLREARKLPLTADQQAGAQRLETALTPDAGIGESWLAETATGAMERQVTSFLTSLKETARARMPKGA